MTNHDSVEIHQLILNLSDNLCLEMSLAGAWISSLLWLVFLLMAKYFFGWDNISFTGNIFIWMGKYYFSWENISLAGKIFL